MISRGKRKHICKLVRKALWNAKSPEEQQASMESFVEMVLAGLSDHSRIPRAILTGSAR